jgi:dihydropteroate synthase
MGILNATPDSFSDGGRYCDATSARARVGDVERYLSQLVGIGAAIVDIGGESTRPGAGAVDCETEMKRIGDILAMAVAMGEISVSVDTHHVETALFALSRGANIVNDVCCTRHFREMASVLMDFDAHLIVTHNARNGGDFASIDDPIGAIIASFGEIMDTADAIGFDRDRIIFDPGIGFGKTAEQDLKIISGVGRICDSFENPVVCAVSKKSFLRTAVGRGDWAHLSGATVAATVGGFLRGCKIFRVHDVAENFAALQLTRTMHE